MLVLNKMLIILEIMVISFHYNHICMFVLPRLRQYIFIRWYKLTVALRHISLFDCFWLIDVKKWEKSNGVNWYPQLVTKYAYTICILIWTSTFLISLNKFNAFPAVSIIQIQFLSNQGMSNKMQKKKPARLGVIHIQHHPWNWISFY